MISVASIMRGTPVDFETKKSTAVSSAPVSYISENQFRGDQDERYSYFANYEVFSTFTPKEHERPGMRFPFYADDPV